MNAQRFRFLSGALVMAAAGFAACSDDSDGNDELPTPDAGLTTDSGTPDSIVEKMDAQFDVAPEAAADVVEDAPADAMNDAADSSDAATAGNALRFDGVDDLVNVTAFDPSETAFTAELWFKAGPLGDGGYLTRGTMFEIHDGAGADRFLFLDDGKACFYVYNPGRGNPKLCSTATFNDGAWHHIAGTLGATNGIRVYVDGQMVASDALTTTSSFTGANQVRFGYGHYAFLSAYVYFKGDIDEVRVWNVERSAAEILANYNQAVAANVAGLQAYWKLEGTGFDPVAVDTVTAADGGPGHNGTLLNFMLDGGAASPWVTPGAY